MANFISLNNERFQVGDVIKVSQTVKEGGKEKVLVFEGRLIAVKGVSPNTTFTVRKIGTDNIGVEKIFPLFSPTISKIALKRKIPARRAKLYYLRDR